MEAEENLKNGNIAATQTQVSYFKALFKHHGYAFFEEGEYNLNIFGVRYLEKVNTFNDFIFVVYKNESKQWVIKQFECTTEAGVDYLKDPMNNKGTGIMFPNQYRGAYQIGLHKGYPALRQIKPIKVYRDNDKDSVHDLDPDTIQEGVFAINIHHATFKGKSTKVGKWSAGCMVFADINEWNQFFSLVKKAATKWGDIFTFTLFESKNLEYKP